MARTYVSTCLCMPANRCKHVRTFLIGYRSGGTPYVLQNLWRVPDCGPLSEEAVPASAPATSRLFLLPVATRRWVLTDNTMIWSIETDLEFRTPNLCLCDGPAQAEFCHWD